MHRLRRAFTLVEIAITLTLLGLIVAAVTSGLYLLEVARLQGVIAEVQKYRTVTSAFKQQYGSLPGDIRNATDFGFTGNGDGDERIEYSGTSTTNEALRAWQHLNAAKMLEGNYTGTGTGTGLQADIGSNIPQASYKSMGVITGYSFYYAPANPSPPASSANALVDNYFVLGAATTNDFNSTVAVEAAHAYYIDKKMDDAAPQTGDVIEPTAGCVTGSGSSSTYARSYTSGCVLYFKVERVQ